MFLRRATVAFVLASTVAASFGASAGAAPDTTDATDAARAIEQNGRRAGALAEALNGAEYRLGEAKAQLAEARAGIAALKVQIDEDRARLAREGAGIYRNASEGTLAPLDLGTDAQARRKVRYGAAAADATRKLVQGLVAKQAALADEEARADAARQAAQDERDGLVRARDQLAAAETRQQELLDAAPPEVTERLAAGAAPATGTTPASGGTPAAAPGAPAAPAPAPSPSPSPAPAPAPTPAPAPAPAPSGGAAAAVAFARAQLGKPYVYAAAGPDAYDCSGLTMAAWRAGGVSLPHYSGAQYARLPKVSMSALQPGDLIFWGPGGSEHVAIYIGGGQIISAPYTGAVVRIQGIWGSPVGAARP